MEEFVNGKYRIVKELGQGTYGIVYLAIGPRPDVGQVVIKLSRDSSEETLPRFMREVEVAATLSHPNISEIIDFGMTNDRRPYVVRRYVEGDTLDTILTTKSRLNLEDALKVARAIGRGLEEAHERGFIHRDLKPSNILIPEKAGVRKYEDAIILDFGVSVDLLMRDRDMISGGVTQVGQIFGTPRYMSPEQITAEGQTTATDVWGLGLMLYEMVYGRLPFPEGSLFQVLSSRFTGQIEFPNDPGIPSDLVKLLENTLKLDQKARIQTVSEVNSALSKIESQLTLGRVVEQSQGRTDTANEKASRLPLLLSILAALFAIPLTGTILWFLLQKGFLNWGTVIGVILVLVGVGASLAVGKLAKARQTEIGKDAQQLLFGSKDRDLLTQSLAIQVDALVRKLTKQDEVILGLSLALMVDEYARDRGSNDGGAKLMNVVTLLEKISTKLSPWYVRHEKLVATAVAMVGILSGVTTITITILNNIKTR